MRSFQIVLLAFLLTTIARADEDPTVEMAKGAARAAGTMWAAAPVCHLKIDQAKLDHFLSMTGLDAAKVRSGYASFAQQGAATFASELSQKGAQETCFKIYDDFGPLRLNVMHRLGEDAP